uniref:Uncharacterized protein n=1 Tax=Elizabethkingia anophelis TaxID=1117645 RepID=A0A455ZGD0_9FLAO|nr:TPA_exp: hypothetical protein [Elizabethkingia anophelis]DAC75720.1 TPA_exp: hypothetical protein [Elizabethkingia anophelis]DAC75724.1 TPA_exp: hypothetical protein [Elizabethkingia anophelis]
MFQKFTAGQHLPNLLFTKHYRQFFLFFNFRKTQKIIA